MTRRQAEVLILLDAKPADTAALTRAMAFNTVSAAGAMLLTLFVRGWVDRRRVGGGPYLYSVTPDGRTARKALRQPMNDRLPRAARAAGSLAHDRQPVPTKTILPELGVPVNIPTRPATGRAGLAGALGRTTPARIPARKVLPPLSRPRMTLAKLIALRQQPPA